MTAFRNGIGSQCHEFEKLLFPYYASERCVQTSDFINGFVLKETGLIQINTDL